MIEPGADGNQSRLGVLVRLGIVLLILAVGVGGVLLLRAATSPEAGPTSTVAETIPAADVEPGAAAPATATAHPQPRA
ncbi:MAG TPA: murein transglycosylase, partial [Actinophytocola sp.]|nr:murein transglycosylase [Actinophytocola sp.]